MVSRFQPRPPFSQLLISFVVLLAATIFLAPEKLCAQTTAPGMMDQKIDFPYYSLREGFHSEMALVNAIPAPIEFVIAIHDLSGNTLRLQPMTIAGGQKIGLDIGSLLSSRQPENVAEEFAEGSVTVLYKATESMLLLGQITITDARQRIVFESEMGMFMMGMNKEPQELNALWWGLGGHRKGQVAVSNTMDQPAEADVFLDFNGERHASSPLTFRPHETKLLSIADLLKAVGVHEGQVPEGGITIVARDMAAMFVAEGHVTDPKTGFSTTLHFLNPQVQIAAALHASGVPIGTPSANSPFAGAGSFTPHVIVRNLLNRPQKVTLTIEYPGARVPEGKVLAPILLSARSTGEFSLESTMEQLPLPLPFCSLRIEYSDDPGSVIAEISSVEARGDLVIDSRLGNEGDAMANSGANPWHVDKERRSVLFLTNIGERQARIGFRIQTGNVTYYLSDIRLSPHETRAIDIGELRDRQQMDFQGSVIPAQASDGSVHWKPLDDVPVLGRLLVMNQSGGVSSNFDCGTVCHCLPNFVGETLTPGSMSFVPGQFGDCAATQISRDCNGNTFSSNNSSSAIWSSSNTAVAFMDSSAYGRVHAAAGGTATISAVGHGFTYYWGGNRCYVNAASHTGQSGATVCDFTITPPQGITAIYCDGKTENHQVFTATLTANSPSSCKINTSQSACGSTSTGNITIDDNPGKTGWNTTTGQCDMYYWAGGSSGQKAGTYRTDIKINFDSSKGPQDVTHTATGDVICK